MLQSRNDIPCLSLIGMNQATDEYTRLSKHAKSFIEYEIKIQLRNFT